MREIIDAVDRRNDHGGARRGREWEGQRLGMLVRLPHGVINRSREDNLPRGAAHRETVREAEGTRQSRRRRKHS